MFTKTTRKIPVGIERPTYVTFRLALLRDGVAITDRSQVPTKRWRAPFLFFLPMLVCLLYV